MGDNDDDRNDFWSFSSGKPHFYTILQTHQQTQKLEIPRKFMEKYGNMLTNTLFLQSPNGELRPVELSKEGNKAWLRKGWTEFVELFSLEHGHLLVFEYQERNEFNVMIFDKTATEIKYRLEESSEESVSFEVSNDSNEQEIDKTSSAEGRANAFRSEYRHFKLVMHPSYISYGSISPPRSFFANVDRRQTVVLLMVADKSWDMILKVYESGRVKILNGWRKFVRENGLEVGDICILELLKSTDIMEFKVTIFKHGD